MPNPSAGAKRFLKVLSDKGVAEKRAPGLLRNWLICRGYEQTKGPGRNLPDYLLGPAQHTEDVELLAQYCSEVHELTYSPRFFSNDGDAKDHIREFAEATGSAGRGLLETYEGIFYVIRAGVDELARKEQPQWDSGPASYHLEINRVGGAGRFEFSYSSVSGGWDGSAVSCGRYIYLMGMDSKSDAKDASAFIFSEHVNSAFRGSLLTGVQLCVLAMQHPTTSDPANGRKNKMAAVARRVVAVRERPNGVAKPAELKEAAQRWITAGGVEGLGFFAILNTISEAKTD